MISLIAAIGKNNELGKGNTLLWHMPADMKFFRETTKGHTIIMGRKTFESLKGALPNRKNIVITRDENYKKEGLPAQAGIEVVHSLGEALKLAQGGRASLDEALKLAGDNDEVFIIGGAEIYNQSMDVADKLYITHIDASDKNADSFFPEIIPIVWNETLHTEHKKDSKNPFDYTFSIYEKFI